MKLNLGSSRRNFEGFTSVDIREGADIQMDLNDPNWNFKDNSIEEIFSAHCFEHLVNPLRAIRECRRILKPGGKLTIIVPNGYGPEALIPAHFSYFSRMWFTAFDPCGCVDNQFDLGWWFDGPKTTYHLFHWAIPFKPFKKEIITTVEKLINSSTTSQNFFEILGFPHPDEIRFTATKSGVERVETACTVCYTRGLLGGCPCYNCGGVGMITRTDIRKENWKLPSD